MTRAKTFPRNSSRAAITAVLLGAAIAGCTSGQSSKTPTSAPVPASTFPTAAAPTPAVPAPPIGSSSAAAVTAADWPTYHGDLQRQGFSQSMPPASGRLAVNQIPLDGQVYASPLVIASTVIVATENNVVYGLSTSGSQRWKVSLASPTPASALKCGDITPIGVTGTPVYDAGSNSVFLVTSTGQSVVQTLVALGPGTGAVKFRRQLTFDGVDPNAMQQRGALAVADGMVWIPFGARAGDCGNYQGRLVGVLTTGAGPQVYYSPPTKRGGGMWNPMGVVVNGAGHLLVVSANGAAFPGDAYDHTNTLLELKGVSLLDSFAPSDWAGRVGSRDRGPP